MKIWEKINCSFLLILVVLVALAPAHFAKANESNVFNIIDSLLKTEKNSAPIVRPSLAYSNPAGTLLAPSTYYKIASYNFISTSSPVIIKKMKFAVSGASEVDYFFVAGKSVYPAYDEKEGWTVTFTDLNIPIETKSSGRDIDIMTYTTALTSKADTDNKPIFLVLKSFDYSYGPNNLRSGTANASATSSTFYLSNARFSISLTPRSDDKLFNKEMNLLDLKVQAPDSGPITLKSIPLNITSVGNAILSSTKNLTVKVDGKILEKLQIATSSLPLAGKTGSTTIKFLNGYTIPAGGTVIFSIYGTPENVYYNPVGNSLTISLGNKKYFLWDDVKSQNFNLNGDFASIYASNASVLSNAYAQEQEPSVKVISPSGGEIWKKNEKKEIKWEAVGGKGFSVYLLNRSTAEQCFVGSYPSTARSASFNLNNTSCKNDISLGGYKAVVDNIPYNKTSKYSTTTAISNSFELVDPSPMKIVYPLGGEVITGDQVINLRWIDSSINAKSKINLSLIKISEATSTITAKTVLPTTVISSGVEPVSINNIGAYDWSIKPKSGQYFLRLSCGEAIVCGVTDSKPFTIIR